MLERIYKFIMTLILTPFLFICFLFIAFACVILGLLCFTLPIVALINPKLIELKVKEK
jgi:hypothetical protein